MYSKQRAALSDAQKLKKQASSVEADIMGVSTFGSQPLPRHEASTASSKNYTFKQGIPPIFPSRFDHSIFISFSKYDAFLS